MSLPILANQPSFDASQSHQFNFSYNGSQVFKNRLVIYKNSDNSQIYNQIQTSFQLYHTLAANILSNSVQYSAKLTVFDKDDVESSPSNIIIFTCHKSPTISANVVQNQIIRNSYLPIQITYSSDDGELLNTWRLTLYDSGQNVISQTDQILATQSMGTTINQLETNHSYSFEIVGTTVNGMACTTGKVSFSVTYIEPTTFSKVLLTNVPEDGTIKIESHLISVDGTSNPSTPSYLGGDRIDLRNSGSSVWFDQGFNITGDFKVQVLLQDITPYSICYIATNGTDTLTVRYIESTFDSGVKGYFLLEVKNSVLTTRCATEPMNVLTGQQIYLTLKRVNDLWSITINDYSLTINEWNALNLTIDQWNTKNLTINQYTSQGKTLLGS